MYDHFEREELQASASAKLDIVGMQPHSREYLEHEAYCYGGRAVVHTADGQSIDHTPGIHFSGSP